jgi:hypothetical protein
VSEIYKLDYPRAPILPASLKVARCILTNTTAPSDVLLHLFNSTRGTEHEVKVDAKYQCQGNGDEYEDTMTLHAICMLYVSNMELCSVL